MILPSLVTPGKLLQSGPASVSSSQLLQTTQKDVEVVRVLPKSSSGPPAPVVTEAQPPILPSTNSRSHKHNGASYHMGNNFRGRGGRGSGISRPVTKFTEDFDFMAMNEKFNKDEVWGYLGRSNKSQSKDKETIGSESDEYDSRDEDNVELRKVEIKPGYNKDDFFDSISSNTSDNDPNHGRTRYSEQMKVDTQTFGDFSRYRSCGLGRGGRFRGTYYSGRGYAGYGYAGRSRGRGRQNHVS